jgi:hypothetical protein
MPLDSEQPRLSPAGGFELQRGGRVVARLRWRMRPRNALGWYLERRARPPRRLEVDAAIDALARDTRMDRESWDERADALAFLSTALALDAADRALRGGLAAASARPLESGRYELHITGLDPVLPGCAFPEAAGVSAGDTSVLVGTFDDCAMTAVVRRVNLLGGRVLAMFRAAPAGERRARC